MLIQLRGRGAAPQAPKEGRGGLIELGGFEALSDGEKLRKAQGEKGTEVSRGPATNCQGLGGSLNRQKLGCDAPRCPYFFP